MTTRVAVAGTVPGVRAWLDRLATLPTRYVAPLPPPSAWRHGGRFAAYMAAALTACVAFIVFAALHPLPAWEVALTFMLVCGLSVYYIVEVVPGGTLWTPADFFTYSAIFILGPWGVVTAALGQTLGYALRRQPGFVRVTYTFGSDLINGAIAYLVFEGVRSLHPAGGLFLPALATGITYDCASLLHVILGTSLGRRSFVGWTLLRDLRFTLPFSAGYAWAAVGALSLFTGLGLAGVTMLAIPVILFQGFLVYLAHAVSQHELEMEAAHLERLALLEDLVDRQRDFVSAAAHELRTPLTTMSGGLELLEQTPDLDPATATALIADVRKESQRLNGLVSALLELAQVDTRAEPRRMPFDWAEMLRSTAGEMRERCRPRALHLDVPSDAGQGHAETVRLRQLLLILADNLAAHTPPESSATLTFVRDDRTTTVTLEDDGPGVPPEMTDRIFERFAVADASRHDAAPGLGLSIARIIAEKHGGTLVAENVAPHGLRLTLRLPVAAGTQLKG